MTGPPSAKMLLTNPNPPPDDAGARQMTPGDFAAGGAGAALIVLAIVVLVLVVKRVEYVHGSDPPTVRVIANNAHHKPYEITLEEAHIIGRIIWSARRS